MPGRSHTRCVSPRQCPSAANRMVCGSASTGGVRPAATRSTMWLRACAERSRTSASRSRAARADRKSWAKGSRSSAPTTSRCPSRSVAATISSRNPGCPRLSASTSAYRAPSASGLGSPAAPCPSAAATAPASACRGARASSGAPTTLHHGAPRLVRGRARQRARAATVRRSSPRPRSRSRRDAGITAGTCPARRRAGADPGTRRRCRARAGARRCRAGTRADRR